MADLFSDQELPTTPPETAPAAGAPLADRLRPRSLDEIVGQEHLTGPDGAIGRMVAAGKLASMILWGPPGTGKTSIARLLADAVGLRFVAISAVFSGVADLKKIFAEARQMAKAGRHTLLFVDEVHRFNRSQQDGFLPYVEDGTVTLVGATTENPSFELNAALLSRCQVLILRRLGHDALEELIRRAEKLEARTLPVTQEAREALIASADGDGRFVLNQVETLFSVEIEQPLGPAELSDLLHRRVPVYDKDREGHYSLISALHKSIRGSDPQAALYYLARMLVAGEEPLYVLRRLTRAAVEDIGMADPDALLQCLAAKDMYDFLGSPEGEIGIVQACLYLATAPKSNAAYMAQKAAWRSAKETGSLMPPMHILNAPTKLMETVGYGKGYAYDHSLDEGFSGQDYWPEEMGAQTFYEPTDRGFEAKVRERLEYWNEQRETAATIERQRGLSRFTARGSKSDVRHQRLLAGPAHELGTKGPHRASHPGRDMDRRPSGKMDARQGHRQVACASQAGRRQARRNARLAARHHRQADHLAGRHHGRPNVSRDRADPRPRESAAHRNFRIPAAANRRGPDLLHRPHSCAHPAPADRGRGERAEH
jgi:putative ATPase